MLSFPTIKCCFFKTFYRVLRTPWFHYLIFYPNGVLSNQLTFQNTCICCCDWSQTNILCFGLGFSFVILQHRSQIKKKIVIVILIGNYFSIIIGLRFHWVLLGMFLFSLHVITETYLINFKNRRSVTCHSIIIEKLFSAS